MENQEKSITLDLKSEICKIIKGKQYESKDLESERANKLELAINEFLKDPNIYLVDIKLVTGSTGFNTGEYLTALVMYKEK